MPSYVLVERFLDGAEPDHDLAPYSDPDKAFRALKALMHNVPELYGGHSPVRRLMVVEAKYEPRHGPLPKRRPGGTYDMADARTEAVYDVRQADTLEAT